jgi:hypothetical protein
VEAGILHSERRKDAIVQESCQRHAGDARDQHGEDFAGGVVEPALAGLIDQREGAVAAHQLVRRK